eukprot:CAMPEP_0202110010 /NCGR_PEP_ID=MMETSP0965-20130614/25437_1 /ASSEMBLY_ACC=CAM_ASM_000507 /TAXON_ID=4773 /ORGANISM="Schizochytrium aggregatum, Strain ATCC28209" /LENGTH=51 /DNA_ID=CAMNT_0048679391 /DNA_START=78 /DNA_END=230 /DNA_ORIENTATION=-
MTKNITGSRVALRSGWPRGDPGRVGIHPDLQARRTRLAAGTAAERLLGARV